MRNTHFPGRSPVYSLDGMVSTSHPLATKAAIDKLSQGGNAYPCRAPQIATGRLA